MKRVLTIAGSDSGGGAGIQADLKTFTVLGVYGMSVITAVTAQNTCQVKNIEELSPEIIGDQLDAVYEDIRVDAVKIGMVSGVDIIKVIGEKLKKWKEKNIILDPVMVSESGHDLLKPEAGKYLLNELFPLALMVTPNLPEAEKITGDSISSIEDMKKAAKQIYKYNPKTVLIKGGHRQDKAVDILYDGQDFYLFSSKKIKTEATHGSGCTYSSAIASFYAGSNDLYQAVKKGKKFVTRAIAGGLDEIGKGSGPTNHLFE